MRHQEQNEFNNNVVRKMEIYLDFTQLSTNDLNCLHLCLSGRRLQGGGFTFSWLDGLHVRIVVIRTAAAAVATQRDDLRRRRRGFLEIAVISFRKRTPNNQS